MKTWRNTVPEHCIASSFAEEPEDNILRAEVQVGRAKRRRRSTYRSSLVSFETRMTEAEYIEFKAMYEVDFADGTLEFERKHPLTGVVTVFEFEEIYRVSARRNGVVYVSMKLRATI